jgi:uncharacterized protein YndB with AHSA1/START domain
MELKFQVYTKIQKPVSEVFDAVYNPSKLSGYFTNGGAVGSLDQGATVEWAFEDEPGKRMAFPVTVKEMRKNELIVLEWEGAPECMTRVEMKFEAAGKNETIVRISESGWDPTDEHLKGSYSNCMGWSHMVSALKAYVEYGIDLRKGAYGGIY